MKKLFLIDGNSILYRAYFATAHMDVLMANKDGVPTNAIFGFANMLDKILDTYQPDHVLVAFDAAKKNFRHELFEKYKGQRKETPPELVAQFDLVREYLACRNIAFYEIEGYEGDDIIGTTALLAEKEGDYEVGVVSGDQDMLQLSSDITTVYRTIHGVTDLEVNTPAFIKEKYNLIPDQIRDLKGLMGDASDNIPGIKGVGEKTALKLLYEYQTVENLAKHLDELKGKMGEKIREGIQTGLDSKQIATIYREVPLPFNLDALVRQEENDEKIRDFYRRYQLYSLLNRYEKNRVVEPEQPFEVQVVTKMPPLQGDFALTCATYDQSNHHNYHKAMLLGLGVNDGKNSYYIDMNDVFNDEDFLQTLKDPTIKKYGYNVKKEVCAFYWQGLEVNGYDFDLQLAAYIINPSLKDEYKIVAESFNYEGLPFEEDVFGKGVKRHIPDNATLGNYYGRAAHMIYHLKDEVEKQLKEANQHELYRTIELPLTFILAKMEINGVVCDQTTLQAQEKELNVSIHTLEEEIYALAGETFNIASPKQLGEILFEKLALKGGKKTKTGYSTAADVLEKLVHVHPIIQKVLDYRTLTKLNSTYVVGLQEQIFEDGKIHTMYNQALTQTGRLSSTDPNLQNIPVRYEEGKKIRHAFKPSYDYILSYDYSQIELRVLASMANVEALIDAFNNDIDIHKRTASDIFATPLEDVTSDMRRNAKAINFGIIYGMSDFGLSQQVGVSVLEARSFIERYYAMYPGIKSFMDEQIQFAKDNGYVATILNRRRYIPEINDNNFMRKELGKRLAMNSPIQGSAADILKLAMIKVDELMQARHMQSKMILQVHDELVFDVLEEELEEMMQLVKEGMEEVYPMAVRLKAEGAYGKTWYELK